MGGHGKGSGWKWRDLVRRLQELGCVYVRSGGDHDMWRTPCGQTINTLGGHLNYEASLNWYHDIRRRLKAEGLDVERGGRQVANCSNLSPTTIASGGVRGLGGLFGLRGAEPSREELVRSLVLKYLSHPERTVDHEQVTAKKVATDVLEEMGDEPQFVADVIHALRRYFWDTSDNISVDQALDWAMSRVNIQERGWKWTWTPYRNSWGEGYGVVLAEGGNEIATYDASLEDGHSRQSKAIFEAKYGEEWLSDEIRAMAGNLFRILTTR